MVGQETDDRVLTLARFVQCFQNRTHAVVGSTDRRVIQREFFSDLRIVKQESRHRHLIRGECFRWLVRIVGAGVERFVRIGNVDHHAEWFVATHADAFLCRLVVRGGLLQVLSAFVRIQHRVPGVWVVRSRMRVLAADGCEVTSCLHQIRKVRVVGMLDLIEALDSVIVWISPRPHHVTRRHAVSDLHMSVKEPQTFAGQLVHVGCRAG